MRIPVNELDIYPGCRFRFEYRLDDLEKSIAEHGQLEPGRAVNENGYKVYIGVRRYLAIKELYERTEDERFAYYEANVDEGLTREQIYMRAIEENRVASPAEFKYTGDPRAVYFWDDSKYDASSYEILKVGSRTVSGPNGPIIISISNFRYEDMIRLLRESYRMNVEAADELEKEIKVFEIGRMPYEEAKEVFESHINWLRDEIVKNVMDKKVIEKSNRIPFVIRVFFDQLLKGGFSEDALNRALNDMTGDPEGYVSKRLFDSYVSGIEADKAVYLFALLKVLASGDVYATALWP